MTENAPKEETNHELRVVSSYPLDNTNFEEYEIVEVRLDRTQGDRGMWICRLEFGFSVEVLRGGPVQPRRGQMVRIYGEVDGFAGPQGVFIDGKEIFMRTDEDQQAYEKEVSAANYAEAQARFDEVKEELYLRLSVLPQTLQGWVSSVRDEVEAELDEGQLFDVLELEHALDLCAHAVGLEILILDGEAGVETFFDRSTSATQQERNSRMADSWFTMSARMDSIGNHAPSPRTKWARGFLKKRQFNIRLSYEDVEIVKGLTLDLVEERTDGRRREIQQWLDTAREAEDLMARRHAKDPATVAEYEKRTEELNKERQERAEATLTAATDPTT